MRVLTVNAGSSSLKLRVLGDADELLASYDGLPDALPPVDAVGHRVVHGGTEFRAPVRVDDTVVARLDALTDLAPLHQPKSLDALRRVRAAVPDVPHVACFDTAFHAGLPAAAATYPLPLRWRERWGVRRYGFHGLSHAWAAGRVATMAPRARRVVTCHLGAGASLAAVLDGCSVDTTMGFTPLEGVAMATRSGSVDPGLVLWLQQHEGLTADQVAEALEHDSGLLGLAGTADMREVLARDDADARLALAVYVHRLRAGVAAMAASLGGLDALAFTGGVGENSPAVRAAAVAGLRFLGVALAGEANARAAGDADVTLAGARVRTLVVRSREDRQIAAHVRAVLSDG